VDGLNLVVVTLGCMFGLVIAFLSFDALLRYQYRSARAEWIVAGRPMGFFFWPPESDWVKSSFTRPVLMLRWAWRTPDWVADEARPSLEALRVGLAMAALAMFAGVAFEFL